MGRYIEIIFDDSGSMNEFVNDEPKHIIAKRLFKEKIIPKLDLKKDHVFLRTLSSDCIKGKSTAIQLDNNISKMMNIIDSVLCHNSTPLYYTIKDSIDACNNSGANENHIFILTDGDDTCSALPEHILGNDFLKIKDQINLNTILLQFAIESPITRNNLTSFSQKIGATNIVINSNELIDFDIIEKRLNKAFIKSGLDKTGKFPHCDVKDSSNFYQLEHYPEYDFYLVELLYSEKLLKWKPSLKKWIDSYQKMELDFLYTLRFRNCLPESQVKQMLFQLQKPYCYSFDCIYWDFKERAWKYFPEIPEVNLLPNPDAMNADNPREELYLENSFDKEKFNSNSYRVRLKNDIIDNDIIESYILEDYNYDVIDPIILRDNDIVQFRNR